MAIGRIRCKFHGTPLHARPHSPSKLLTECDECLRWIEELTAHAEDTPAINDSVDVVLHGCDTLLVYGAFGSDLRAAVRDEFGDDELPARQMDSLLRRGRAWREPIDYAEAWLPSTNARYAAVAAQRRKQDVAFRAQRNKAQRRPPPVCVNGHDQLLYRRVCPGGQKWCLLCCRKSAAERRRKNRNSLQVRAWEATREAIRIGQLVRQPCEICGAITPTVHAHHDDYSKPLDVRWLCLHHHVMQHHSLFKRLLTARNSVRTKAGLHRALR